MRLGRGGGDLIVGRDTELGPLEDLVCAVVAGRGGAAWVEGEPGIGKSALLAAGLAEAAPSGCQVFSAAADESGQRFPLRVLLDCLEIVPGSPDPARQEILAPLLAGGSSGAAPVDPVPAVAEGVLTLVDRLCTAPVVLVVDDLHWADEASLMVWQRLVRKVRQLPLLLVAACRPVPRRAELVQLRRSVADAGAAMVTLEPLTADPVAALVGGLLGAREVGLGLRRAVAQAAGNPLYVREMVDALARDRRLRTDVGRVDLVEGGAVEEMPDSLVAAISDRLGFVSDEAQQMLRFAALLGAEFPVTDLALLAGRPATELAPILEETVRAGVLVESGVRLRFRHALIRQVLHDSTPTALRLALHQQAARALADAGAAAERVAYQLLAALTQTDPGEPVDDWVLDWLTGPGRDLTHRSPPVAAELLERAVRYTPLDDPRREDLQITLASVLAMSGRREEAVPLAEGIRTTSADPARAAEATWIAARVLHVLRLDQAAAVLDETLTRPDLPDVWRVRLVVWRGRVALFSGDTDVGARRGELAEAERVGDPLAAAIAADTLAGALYANGDSSGAAAVLEQAMAALGDNPETADRWLSMLSNRAGMLESLDRLPEADAAYRELLTASERDATPHRLTINRISAVEFYFETGRWAEAATVLETIAEDRLPAPPLYKPVIYGVAALLAAHRDDDVEAREHLAADVPVNTGAAPVFSQYPMMARAVLAERDGEPDRALAILAANLGSGAVAEMPARRLWLPMLTRLALAAGDAATAASAAAVAAADEDVARDSIPSRTAASEHCRGLLDTDPTPLLAAADRYRRVGRPVELATVLEDAAALLAGRGDAPAAAAAYAEATERYTALGAEWDLRRADTRLRPYGLRRRRARRRPATGWNALTPTELTVAQLVAEGLSNPDIAARQFLSRRTIDVHVSHILAKLGVRSRVEIAREAIRHESAVAR